MPPRLGTDVEAWFQAFFKAVIGISTLGAGFTFTIIFTDLELQHPPTPAFNAETVRTRLSICWLLFVIALMLTSGYATYTTLKARGETEEPYFANCQNTGQLLVPSLMSLLLQLLLIGAFMAASLAIMEYGKVGLAAVILTAITGGVLVIIWLWNRLFNK